MYSHLFVGSSATTVRRPSGSPEFRPFIGSPRCTSIHLEPAGRSSSMSSSFITDDVLARELADADVNMRLPPITGAAALVLHRTSRTVSPKSQIPARVLSSIQPSVSSQTACRTVQYRMVQTQMHGCCSQAVDHSIAAITSNKTVLHDRRRRTRDSESCP